MGEGEVSERSDTSPLLEPWQNYSMPQAAVVQTVMKTLLYGNRDA